MEPSTSKLGINVLLILAILLIGGSLFVTYTKKPTEPAVVVKPVTTTPSVAVTYSPELTNTTASTTNLATTTGVIATSSTSQMGVGTGTTASLLTNKSWVWVKTTATGTKDVVPKKIAAFTMIFTATGTISGTTDCNKFFGSYKSDATKLSFGPFGSTRMFCEGSQESVFLAAMEGVKNYTIDSNKNLILTTSSSTIFFK